MKKSWGLLFLLCILILPDLSAQIIDWVKPYEGEIFEKPKNIDADGNSYGFMDIDLPNEYGDTSLVDHLVKYDKNGVLIWKVLLPRSEYNNRRTLVVDSEGNIIVSRVLDYYSFLSVSKYSPTGEKIFETLSEQNTYGCFIFPEKMSIDKNNNIYVAGTMNGFIQFGPFSLKSPIVWEDEYYTEYYQEAFLVKLNTHGQFQWGKISHSFSPYSTQLTALTTDKFGNVFIGGTYNLHIDFQGYVLKNYSDAPDFFVVKYDSTGATNFVLGGGSFEGWDVTEDLSSDEDGNIYVRGTADVPFVLNNWIASDTFLVKLSPSFIDHPIVYRINAGGPDISASGKIWEKDYQTQRSIYLDPHSSNHTTGSFYSWKGVNNTGAPNTIFGSNRYDWPMGGEMFYNFPLPNGRYKLSLFFAEKILGVSHAGERIFSVDVESKRVLSDYDIYASVGLNADARRFYVDVKDGVMDIDFIRQIGNPQINGIEIISLDATEGSTELSRSSVTLRRGSRFSITGGDADVILISAKDEEDATATFKVYDVQGKLVYEDSLTSVESTYNLNTTLFRNGFQHGLYLININNEETIKMIR